ncbi:MAG: hypothetical protein QNK37_29020 [Acidobacteriota bacterium]|nr:hypothetical protein [Acidobacteriota bacterium]
MLVLLIAFCFFQEVDIDIESLGIQTFDNIHEQTDYYLDLFSEVTKRKLKNHKFGDELPLNESALIGLKVLYAHRIQLSMLRKAYQEGILDDRQMANDTIGSYRILGEALIEGGLFDEARSALKELLQLESGTGNVPSIYRRLALIEKRLGNEEEEIRLLTEAVSLPFFGNVPETNDLENHMTVLRRLAAKQVARGEYEKASKHYRHYFKLSEKWGMFRHTMVSHDIPNNEAMPKKYRLKNLDTRVKDLERNKARLSEQLVKVHGSEEAVRNLIEEAMDTWESNWRKWYREQYGDE